MSQWPTQQDYDAAIKVERMRGLRIRGLTLRTYSAQEAQAKGASFLKGRAYTDRGNFAIVYQLSETTGHSFVFRVFTDTGSSIADLQRRYIAVSNLVRSWPNDWLVNVQWLSEGLLIDGSWKPAVLMERIEGVDLEKWLHANKTDKAKLESIASQVRRFAREFAQHDVAHGDLSHRNLMVNSSDQLKVVDYDGMYLQSLRDAIPKESGLPGMQHPQRRISSYGPNVDRFSILVLYATLLYIKWRPNSLPMQCDDGLILLKEHFLDPVGSPLDTMLRSSVPELRKVANAIVEASKKPFTATPTLEEVLNGPAVAPRSLTKNSTGTAPVPSYLQTSATARTQPGIKRQQVVSTGSSSPPPVLTATEYQSVYGVAPAHHAGATSPPASSPPIAPTPHQPPPPNTTSPPWKFSDTLWALFILGMIGWGGVSGFKWLFHRGSDAAQTSAAPSSIAAPPLRTQPTAEVSAGNDPPSSPTNASTSPQGQVSKPSLSIEAEDAVPYGAIVRLAAFGPGGKKCEIKYLDSPCDGFKIDDNHFLIRVSRKTTILAEAEQQGSAPVVITPNKSIDPDPDVETSGPQLRDSVDMLMSFWINFDFSSMNINDPRPEKAWVARTLKGADLHKLHIYRNIPFANRGLIFTSNPSLTDEFSGRDWYHPRSKDSTRIHDSMTDQEKKNFEYVTELWHNAGGH